MPRGCRKPRSGRCIPISPARSTTSRSSARWPHKPAEAEQFYRRAYAIASTALEPQHLLVTTSRDNLRDFCAARGLPLDATGEARRSATSPIGAAGGTGNVPAGASAPAGPARAGGPDASRRAREPWRPAVMPPAAEAPPLFRSSARARSRPARRLAAALLAVAVMAGAAVWFSMNRGAPAAPTDAAESVTPPPGETAAAPAEPQPSPSAAMPDPSPAAVPAPRADATAAEPPAAPPPAAPTSAPASPPVSSPAPSPPETMAAPAATPTPAAPGAAAAAATTSATAAATDVRVLVAEVCQSLTTGAGAWRCDATGPSAAAGRFSFYTRIASPRAITVQHRWYRGESLHQSVGLRISANPSAGYRTFSRQTVSPGAWRVELRSADGAVLQEVRFVVQ